MAIGRPACSLGRLKWASNWLFQIWLVNTKPPLQKLQEQKRLKPRLIDQRIIYQTNEDYGTAQHIYGLRHIRNTQTSSSVCLKEKRGQPDCFSCTWHVIGHNVRRSTVDIISSIWHSDDLQSWSPVGIGLKLCRAQLEKPKSSLPYLSKNTIEMLS